MVLFFVFQKLIYWSLSHSKILPHFKKMIQRQALKLNFNYEKE